MNPAAVQAVRIALDEWRREASGSAAQAERYAEQAARIRADAEPTALDFDARAAEHRDDAARAERQVAELEQTLRDEGLEP